MGIYSFNFREAAIMDVQLPDLSGNSASESIESIIDDAMRRTLGAHKTHPSIVKGRHKVIVTCPGRNADKMFELSLPYDLVRIRTEYKITQSAQEDGTLLERDDGERFLLCHLNDDGSAQLIHLTPGKEPSGVHLDVNQKIVAAREWIMNWPNNAT